MRQHRRWRTIILGLAAFLGAAWALVGQEGTIVGGMTGAERTYFVSELQSSEAALLASIMD